MRVRVYAHRCRCPSHAGSERGQSSWIAGARVELDRALGHGDSFVVSLRDQHHLPADPRGRGIQRIETRRPPGRIDGRVGAPGRLRVAQCARFAMHVARIERSARALNAASASRGWIASISQNPSAAYALASDGSSVCARAMAARPSGSAESTGTCAYNGRTQYASPSSDHARAYPESRASAWRK